MTSRSIPAIDPGGVARRRGADGEGIVIAVVGSGIDGRHPHFARYANLDLPPLLQHCDLTLVRDRGESEGSAGNLGIGRVDDWRLFDTLVYGEDPAEDEVIAHLSTLDDDLLSEEALIDRHGHSTHVAAIVAGYVERKDAGGKWDLVEPWMGGVAPKCKLLSLKVIDDEGKGDEFDVIRALHLVWALNVRARKVVVHGVLVSLSIPHDVANYACGRTPVCNAVDRLVRSGVVVVAPSGDLGYMRIPALEEVREFAALMGITDPGNTERAITVGATHRLAQEYGPSYFSSRGPTLDGRSKPDLLAPGEKILSAVPASAVPPAMRQTKGKKRSRKRPTAKYAIKDGTAMAAAHVAGAVAVVLSARPELIGRPELVKELLISTATDLGRLPYFQGRGLLNLSRALGDDARIEAQPVTEEQSQQAAPHARAQIVLPDTEQTTPLSARTGGKRFAVALSFPGEHREYVKRVVYAMREVLRRSDIFYDKFYGPELSRPDLDVYLIDIYSKQSELVVVFLSADYEKKEWCGLEWRAVRELIKTKESHAVMPVRFDDTHIPGLLSIDGYLSAKNRDPEQIADSILERLQANRSRGLV